MKNSNSENIKAIILAAGEGSRLRPYTDDRPKCLVEVERVSLLDRQLMVLSTEIAEPVIIIGGYRVDMLKRPGIKLRINKRYAETNMVWTLFCAEEDLKGSILISYGDIVYSRGVLKKIIESDADIAIAVDLDWESYWRARNEDPLDDAETLKILPNGQLLEIGKKPNSLAEIDGQYMGLMKFSSNGTKLLKKAFNCAKTMGHIQDKPIEQAYMTDLLQTMIDMNYRLDAVPVRGEWVEVDTVNDLLSPVTKSRLAQVELSI